MISKGEMGLYGHFKVGYGELYHYRKKRKTFSYDGDRLDGPVVRRPP